MSSGGWVSGVDENKEEEEEDEEEDEKGRKGKEGTMRTSSRSKMDEGRGEGVSSGGDGAQTGSLNDGRSGAGGEEGACGKGREGVWIIFFLLSFSFVVGALWSLINGGVFYNALLSFPHDPQKEGGKACAFLFS